jgi:hypothetical protein
MNRAIHRGIYQNYLSYTEYKTLHITLSGNLNGSMLQLAVYVLPVSFWYEEANCRTIIQWLRLTYYL